jgi:hypothetical protein
MPSGPHILAHAPAELTEGKLRRLGEGIGKVVYASPHWVVKRERSEHSIVALIFIWRFTRRLPRGLRVLAPKRPSLRLRIMRMVVELGLRLLPKPVWYWSHAGEVWRTYRFRDRRGERLAEKILTETDDLPLTVTFPPVEVRVGGWPGWLTVSEATERVEETLLERLKSLAEAGSWDEVETWLDRLIEFRVRGWGRGLFSVDAHLKNYGVAGNRVVLLDVGGLTDHWDEVEEHLDGIDEARAPHRRLGLGEVLAGAPDVAARFDERWAATLHVDTVWQVWPKPDADQNAGTVKPAS